MISNNFLYSVLINHNSGAECYINLLAEIEIYLEFTFLK